MLKIVIICLTVFLLLLYFWSNKLLNSSKYYSLYIVTFKLNIFVFPSLNKKTHFNTTVDILIFNELKGEKTCFREDQGYELMVTCNIITGNIITDLFALLPSGRRYRSLCTRTSRHKNSFFPPCHLQPKPLTQELLPVFCNSLTLILACNSIPHL